MIRIKEIIFLMNQFLSFLSS